MTGRVERTQLCQGRSTLRPVCRACETSFSTPADLTSCLDPCWPSSKRKRMPLEIIQRSYLLMRSAGTARSCRFRWCRIVDPPKRRPRTVRTVFDRDVVIPLGSREMTVLIGASGLTHPATGTLEDAGFATRVLTNVRRRLVRLRWLPERLLPRRALGQQPSPMGR